MVAPSGDGPGTAAAYPRPVSESQREAGRSGLPSTVTAGLKAGARVLDALADVLGPAPEPEPEPTMTGVVFVHGIGTQPARETLFEWARPLTEVLAEWRREHDEAHPEAPLGENPVRSASVSDPANPLIELDIPAWAGRGASRWLLTEAYWAGDLRAPSFADAIGYLRRRIIPIVRGIARGYGLRERRRRERLLRLVGEHEGTSDPEVRELVAEVRRSLSRRWALVDGLDSVWHLRPVRWLLAIVAGGVSLAALSLYAPLRAIPIAGVRRRVELAAFDAFLVDWFGDLPVLLDDPAQAAVVRTRLVERIAWLRAQGCGPIVVVAHSGGAIVSYATLLRHGEAELPVHKLVTLGQGLALGWRLEQAAGTWVAGNAIRGDLGAARPNLRWVDVWASYDPAPAGELVPVDGCPLVAVESLRGAPLGSPIHVESRPVTNLMHMGEDHGAYWANDEGFLLPLIRHIDDPTGDGSGSRFYRDPLARTVRTERRRRRVSLLLAWRWAAFAVAVLAVAVASREPVTLGTTGDAVAAVWSRVPGHELVSGPVDGIGAAVAALLGAVGLGGPAAGVAAWGPTLLGALVPLLAVFAVYSRGVGSWRAADALERRGIRRERLRGPGRASTRSEAVLLVGGLVAILVAAAGPPAWVMVALLGAIAVLALVTRAS